MHRYQFPVKQEPEKNRRRFSLLWLLTIDECRAELEKREEKYDIIVGDLADPVEGGPCYQLYTKSFYEQVLKPKLHHHGIFVTQVPILKES